MRYSKQPEESLVPFEVIRPATQGDPEALASVLKHFEKDIAQMSIRIFYDEFGQSHRCVDYDLKQRIECRLMAQIILKFKIRSDQPTAGDRTKGGCVRVFPGTPSRLNIR